MPRFSSLFQYFTLQVVPVRERKLHSSQKKTVVLSTVLFVMSVDIVHILLRIFAVIFILSGINTGEQQIKDIAYADL